MTFTLTTFIRNLFNKESKKEVKKLYHQGEVIDTASGLYVVVSNDEENVLAYSCPFENESSNDYMLSHARYNLEQDAYVSFKTLHTVSKSEITRKVDRLSDDTLQDMNRIINILNQRGYVLAGFATACPIRPGDIIMQEGEIYYIQDQAKNSYDAFKLLDTNEKKRGVELHFNGISKSFCFDQYRKISKSNQDILISSVSEEDKYNISGIVRKWRRKSYDVTYAFPMGSVICAKNAKPMIYVCSKHDMHILLSASDHSKIEKVKDISGYHSVGIVDQARFKTVLNQVRNENQQMIPACLVA